MTKHRIFISYYHKDDEKYKNILEEKLGDYFINESVQLGEINTDNSTEYIRRVIREEKISNTSVLIVLVGPHTYCRKHVDWEISAGLDRNAGLVGLVLPEHDCYGKKSCHENTIPPRFYENWKSNYAKLYFWPNDLKNIVNWVEEAFNNKNKNKDLIKNPKKKFTNNRCE